MVQKFSVFVCLNEEKFEPTPEMLHLFRISCTEVIAENHLALDCFKNTKVVELFQVMDGLLGDYLKDAQLLNLSDLTCSPYNVSPKE